MNPDTNRFEALHTGDSPLGTQLDELERKLNEQSGKLVVPAPLLRPDNTPVPEHWTVLSVNETVVIKTHTFRVVHIGESYLVLEPVGPVLVGVDPAVDPVT